MRVQELLSRVVVPEKIESTQVRDEINAFLLSARNLLGINQRRTASLTGQQTEQIAAVHDIFFVDMAAANAFVFRRRGGPTIAVTLGVPFITRALFIATLSEAKIFQSMRDVHYLRIPYATRGLCDWPGLIELINDFSMEKYGLWAKSVPVVPHYADCSGRGDLAIILSMQAWVFFVFHELGHLEKKHLRTAGAGHAATAHAEWDTSNSDSRSMQEAVHRPGSSRRSDADLANDILFSHLNELDADRYAIARMYMGFFRLHPAVENTSSNYVAMTAMSERSRARLWIVTIGTVFLMFEVAGRSRAANTHPRPLFRLQHLIEFSRVQASQIAGSNGLAEFDQGCAEAQRDLTLIGEKLGVHNPFAAGSDDEIYKARLRKVSQERTRKIEADFGK